MNKIAILPLKELPSSCRDCNIFRNCVVYNMIYNKSRSPQCPLIQLDIEELEEAIKQQELILDNIGASGYKIGSSWKVIKDLINKLGGKENG